MFRIRPVRQPQGRAEKCDSNGKIEQVHGRFKVHTKRVFKITHDKNHENNFCKTGLEVVEVVTGRA